MRSRILGFFINPLWALRYFHECGKEELPLILHTLPVLLQHWSQPGKYSREWQEEFNKPFRIESPDIEDSVMRPFVFFPFFVSICDSFYLGGLSSAGWDSPIRGFKINHWISRCISKKPWKGRFLFFWKALSWSVGGDVKILWIFYLQNGETK